MPTKTHDFEVIPGNADRSGHGVIVHWWWLYQKRHQDSQVAQNRLANCDRSIKRHKIHCKDHTKDKQAAGRLMDLWERRVRLSMKSVTATYRFENRDHEYRQKMMGFAELPLEYRSTALVDIIDASGSVRIQFGPGYLGCWIVYANGAIDRRHTPSGPSEQI